MLSTSRKSRNQLPLLNNAWRRSQKNGRASLIREVLTLSYRPITLRSHVKRASLPRSKVTPEWSWSRDPLPCLMSDGISSSKSGTLSLLTILGQSRARGSRSLKRNCLSRPSRIMTNFLFTTSRKLRLTWKTSTQPKLLKNSTPTELTSSFALSRSLRLSLNHRCRDPGRRPVSWTITLFHFNSSILTTLPWTTSVRPSATSSVPTSLSTSGLVKT